MIDGFVAGWVLVYVGPWLPLPGLWAGLWGVVSLPGMRKCVWFFVLLSLVVVGCFGLLPSPKFLGEVLSVFLFFWALGSCFLWLWGFGFWK